MSGERSTTKPHVGLAAIALAFDAILVVVFAAIGRGSHARAATIAGLFETAWPFLAGLAITWVVALVWRSPLAIFRAGVPVWIGTVALGMLFRMLSGQGTALPFVIVATLTLALMLIGWRAIVAIVSKLRKRQQSA